MLTKHLTQLQCKQVRLNAYPDLVCIRTCSLLSCKCHSPHCLGSTVHYMTPDEKHMLPVCVRIKCPSSSLQTPAVMSLQLCSALHGVCYHRVSSSISQRLRDLHCTMQSTICLTAYPGLQASCPSQCWHAPVSVQCTLQCLLPPSLKLNGSKTAPHDVEYTRFYDVFWLAGELPITMLACARIGAVHSVVFATAESQALHCIMQSTVMSYSKFWLVGELPITMLACARIGAVHSVVFAGFSAESLASRVEDCNSRVVVTTSGVMRGKKKLDTKGIVDNGLSIAEKNGFKVCICISHGGDCLSRHCM